MADTPKTTEPGFFTKTVSAIKNTFGALGDAEWKVPEALLGATPSDKLAQSVDALSKGRLTESWKLGKEAEGSFMSHPGVEGTALPGPGGQIVGTLIHNVMGSADYKPVTDKPFMENLSQNHHSVMAAVSHDLSRVKEWVTGGQEAKDNPAQSLPQVSVKEVETKR